MPGDGNIGDHIGCVVAAVVYIGEVVARLVGPGHQIGRGRHGLIDDDQCALHADGRSIARLRADGAYVPVPRRPHFEGTDRVGQLGLVDFHVAAHDRQYKRIPLVPTVADGGHHKEGLGDLVRGDIEQRGQFLHGRSIGRGDFLGRGGCFLGIGRFGEGGDLAVGRVPAVVAQEQGIFADRR